RAAWLKDRKAMFRAPMQVTAADLKVTAGPDTVVVDLQQTWTQGDFADTGHKRLTLDAAASQIVGEDMLDSHVLLTEGICVRLLCPGASWPRRRTGDTDGAREVLAVTVQDLGAWSVCQVDVKSAESVDVAIAALRYDKGWQLGGRVDTDR